jgi:hypothetical protein
MMIDTTHLPAAKQTPSDVVLEVPAEDQDGYARHSYHDLIHAWNALVRDLANARRAGDTRTASRLTEELLPCRPIALARPRFIAIDRKAAASKRAEAEAGPEGTS